MLYWRRVLAVVRGCQASERISAKPGGVRKRARLGYTERSCTSGLYSGSGLRPILRRVKHVAIRGRVGVNTLKKVHQRGTRLQPLNYFVNYGGENGLPTGRSEQPKMFET